MRKNISLAAAMIVFSLLGVGYFVGGRTPEMRSPIRITDAYALLDGGSIWIELTDAEGKRFAIDVSGNLHQQTEDFPVHIQRWWPVLPVPVRVSPGTDNGRALLEVVERAGRDGGAHAAQQLAPVRIALAQPSRREDRRQNLTVTVVRFGAGYLVLPTGGTGHERAFVDARFVQLREKLRWCSQQTPLSAGKR